MLKKAGVLVFLLLSHEAAMSQRVALERYDLRREKGEIVFGEDGRRRIKEAEERLKERTLTVVRDTMRIEGADAHDYMSLAPYWFDNGEGIWERHDGERNPETERWEDKRAMNNMVREVSLLALAERLHTQEGDERNAQRAADRMSEILRVWFVDERTRMNPNMQYAQFIPGKGREGKVRGAGLIESRCLMDVVESVEMVKADGRADEALLSELRLWFRGLTEWMLDSPQGQKERQARNNHGTWYDAQVLMYAHFCGMREWTGQIQQELKARLRDQIDEEGAQKYEMERTKSLSYCCFNILAYEYCKNALEKEGVDVTQWEEWRRVERAKERIRPYAENSGMDWTGQQIVPFEKREWQIISR
ncbi:MAG: alginate lyase family protein [Paludibacteraceae bacterium]|nr:alginate lyase family protein [Paludibacteraceae bacterium]